MDLLDWGVVAGGLAAIGWVNWYFFLAGGEGAPPPPSGDAPVASSPTPRR